MAKQARVTVKSIAGSCGAGYQVGDSFITDGVTIQVEKGKGVCLFAIPSLIPYLSAYCSDTLESAWINMISELQCPDATNTVVFGIERV